jgi:hypothetical protein
MQPNTQKIDKACNLSPGRLMQLNTQQVVQHLMGLRYEIEQSEKQFKKR